MQCRASDSKTEAQEPSATRARHSSRAVTWPTEDHAVIARLFTVAKDKCRVDQGRNFPIVLPFVIKNRHDGTDESHAHMHRSANSLRTAAFSVRSAADEAAHALWMASHIDLSKYRSAEQWKKLVSTLERMNFGTTDDSRGILLLAHPDLWTPPQTTFMQEALQESFVEVRQCMATAIADVAIPAAVAAPQGQGNVLIPSAEVGEVNAVVQREFIPGEIRRRVQAELAPEDFPGAGRPVPSTPPGMLVSICYSRSFLH